MHILSHDLYILAFLFLYVSNSLLNTQLSWVNCAALKYCEVQDGDNPGILLKVYISLAFDLSPFLHLKEWGHKSLNIARIN